MTTRISGKKMAAGITATIAVGSLAVVGIGALAVDQATASKISSTTSVTGKSGESPQDHGSGEGAEQGNGYSGGYSGGDSVLPGNGGSVGGQSSGS